MKTKTQKRTAKDPEDYVRRLRATNPQIVEAEIVSIDGETRTGQKRYTLRLISDENYYRKESPK